MYQVDDQDEVVQIEDAPQFSIGAPKPFVFSTEDALLLGYFIETRTPSWDGSTVRVVSPTSAADPIALVEFKKYRAYFLGPPNDEAFGGHPLASRGLRPSSIAQVRDSSWLRLLERMNSVHPYHEPSRFVRLKHFVFAFHDSTFECVAEDFDVSVRAGPMRDLWPELRQRIQW